MVMDTYFGAYFHTACAKMVRNGPASPNYPAKAAAICMRCHEYAHPPPPYPTFFASAKRIFKLDCAN